MFRVMQLQMKTDKPKHGTLCCAVDVLEEVEEEDADKSVQKQKGKKRKA
jgi:hypothetical protein